MLKQILKKLIPATYDKVDSAIHRIENILKLQSEKNDELKTSLESLEKELRQISYNVGTKNQEIAQLIRQISATQIHSENVILKELKEIKDYFEKNTADFKGQILEFQKEVLEIHDENTIIKRLVNEVLWAHTFENTIVNSKWLIDKTFSPGRWAMGYPELYVLYRILDEFAPKCILEIGLGQSTRMITQYAATDNHIKHYVVENDTDWIAFFQNKNDLAENTHLVNLNLHMESYKEANAVRSFQGFKEYFLNQQFDFVMIDAPLGSDMKEYSRIDILSIIPNSLSHSFVIILDDAERQGELNTAREIDRILQKNQILFKRNFYTGIKDLCIWTSIDAAFLCSM